MNTLYNVHAYMYVYACSVGIRLTTYNIAWLTLQLLSYTMETFLQQAIKAGLEARGEASS